MAENEREEEKPEDEPGPRRLPNAGPGEPAEKVIDEDRGEKDWD